MLSWKAVHDSLTSKGWKCYDLTTAPESIDCVLQVARIAAALALAPALDKACLWAQHKLHLKSQRTALNLVVAACLALAATTFAAVVLLWA